jgi:predicted anti-sigma-YlaC factor YlaD
MTCAEFVQHYTEYRDGLITAPREARRFARHLMQCPSCRRHDGALRRGLKVLQETDTVYPSPDFRRRLEQRLQREGLTVGREVAPARAGLVAAVFIGVAIALVAFQGVEWHRAGRIPELAPVPFPKPVAQAGYPFVSFQDPRASVVYSNPNPYGTALIEPVAAGR